MLMVNAPCTELPLRTCKSQDIDLLSKSDLCAPSRKYQMSEASTLRPTTMTKVMRPIQNAERTTRVVDRRGSVLAGSLEDGLVQSLLKGANVDVWPVLLCSRSSKKSLLLSLSKLTPEYLGVMAEYVSSGLKDHEAILEDCSCYVEGFRG